MSRLLDSIPIIVIGILFAVPVFSQYTREAFDLHRASDLYDERGYGENSSISVDGNLIVSNSTGVPSYVYPISRHTISGYPLEVTLNYAGSVQFTTFDTYAEGADHLSLPEYFRWSKLQQNRPAWILGVNGFAIQALHNALSFHNNPKVKEEMYEDQGEDLLTNDQFIWMIDGYSFCNRMLSFRASHNNNDPEEANAYVDVIKLLRSDGSVLELVNATSTPFTIYIYNSPDLYTGYYAVNEANAGGYAIVEYEDSYWPDYIKAAAGLNNASAQYHNDLRPRRVRYFPGDGLEYVFREWLIPYGVYSYNGNNGGANGRENKYGGPRHAPTIFYLDELRGASGQLTTFTRSRHYPPEKIEEIFGVPGYEDKSRGRALITDFDGHHIEYMDNALIIDALGRTTKVEFHKVLVDGSKEERQRFDSWTRNPDDPDKRAELGLVYLHRYGYLFPTQGSSPRYIIENFAEMFDESRTIEDPLFRSYLGMVTRIIDPMGRVTTFDYMPVKRKHDKMNFPRSNGDKDGYDVELEFENWYLSKVTEPASVLDICYQLTLPTRGYALTPNYSCDVAQVQTFDVNQVRTFDVYAEPWGPSIRKVDPFVVNGIVSSVTRSFCDETLAHTAYKFDFFYDNDLNVIEADDGIPFTQSSTITNFDYENGTPISAKTTIMEFYRSDFLSKSVPGYPKKRFTAVRRATEFYSDAVLDINGKPEPGSDIVLKTKTETLYPDDPVQQWGHEYVMLPLRKTSYVIDPATDDEFITTDYEYDYEFETARKYYDGTGDFLQDRTQTFGNSLIRKDEILREQGNAILRKRTSYLNIQYDPTKIGQIPQCRYWDKLASLARYRATYPDGIPSWEEVSYHPDIAVFKDNDVAVVVPPVFGLPEETALYDPTQMDPSGLNPDPGYLGGTRKFYGGSSAYPVTGEPWLTGKLIEEQQVAESENGATPAVITTAEYGYDQDDCRVVLKDVTNANRVKKTFEYWASDQDGDGGNGVFVAPTLALLHNDDKVTEWNFQPPLYFNKLFEKPLSTVQTVRKTDEQDIETLKTFAHLTYYGLTEGTVDPNKWYSRFDYDNNGRIRGVLLPGDVRPFDDPYPYVGIEEMQSMGGSHLERVHQDLFCNNRRYSYSEPYNPDPEVLPTQITHSGVFARSYKYPQLPPTECPCINEGTSDDEKGASLQEDCYPPPITFPLEETAVGYLGFISMGDDPETPENEANPLYHLQSLTDAKLRLVVSRLEGECVTLRVTSPEGMTSLDYRRVFGPCPNFDKDPGLYDVVGRAEEKPGDVTTQSTGEACDAETEVYEEEQGHDVVEIPLDKEYLQNMEPGERVTFKFEVLSANTAIHFAWLAEDTRPRLILNGSFSDSKRDDYDYTFMVEYNDKNLTSKFSSKVDDYRHTANTYKPDPSNPTAFNSNPSIPHAFTSTGPNRYAEVENRFGADYRVLKTKTLLVNEDNLLVSTPTTSYEYTGNGLVTSVRDPLDNLTLSDYDLAGRAIATTTPPIDIYIDGSKDSDGDGWMDFDGNDDTPGVLESGTLRNEYIHTRKTATGEPDVQYDPTTYGPLDLSDQDFYHEYLQITAGTDENGVHKLTVADARGKTRLEAFGAADWGNLQQYYDRHVKYEYDIQNRLTSVINPEGHRTTYDYDTFGRLEYKTQPDMGTTSYAYDNAGNLRFTQTEQQNNDQKLTFYQYDDLNRLTLVGEAQFVPEYHPGTEGDLEKKTGLSATDPRLSDRLEEQTHYLHLGTGSDYPLTWNPTIWTEPYGAVPPTPQVQNALNGMAVEENCLPDMMTIFDEMPPNPPYLVAGVRNWNPIPAPAATLADFENVAKYPNHPRMAIHYDELPRPIGDIWGGFPDHDRWHRLMPRRADWFDEDDNPNTTDISRVSNLKGREAAVAYRDHSGEPYHYTVTSYDPRGRVEAVIHYTENLGFDAVYYEYNSMNLITKVRTIDPFRQHTTWYGYDANGRLDSVWTKLSDYGTGFAGRATLDYPWLNSPRYPSWYDEQRPGRDRTDILYSYDQRGLLEQKRLQPANDKDGAPGLGVVLDYTYNARGWISGMDAAQAGSNLFNIKLEYDQRGQILKQTSEQGAAGSLSQHYEYDRIGRLTDWVKNRGLPNQHMELYDYDKVGNRIYTWDFSNGKYRDHSYGDINTGSGGLAPNRLNRVHHMGDQVFDPSSGFRWTTLEGTTDYTYDLNGAIARRMLTIPGPPTGGPPYLEYERFSHSYRGLLWGYTKSRSVMNNTAMSTPDDWRYRYNAQGERESKRLYNGIHNYPEFNGDTTIVPDTTVVRFDLIRVSTDPPVFHGLVNIGGDTTEATFSENTITFSDTALANLGENTTIAGEAALITSNFDTTIVNFGGEILNDPSFFDGLVSIAGDTTGVVFSKDTITFSDTALANLGENIIISGNAMLITHHHHRDFPYPWRYYLLDGRSQ
ncbi:MAG: RHS repeat protein, partial [Chlorobi bacterium]|nr:RHS repeat protein [Chlorobiota bacterium]